MGLATVKKLVQDGFVKYCGDGVKIMAIKRITAKQLGWLKMVDVCPRCLWLMQKHPLPEESVYSSPLSRIFRQFEGFVQRSIIQVTQQTGNLPLWLVKELQKVFPSMPNVRSVLTQKSWSVQVNDVELRGVADILFQLEDDTYFIADFKLSRPSDRYAPLYETQLNAYAFLARQNQLPVSRLALIYFELDERTVAMATNDSIMAPMKCIVQPVDIWGDDEIKALVREMSDLLSLQKPPDPKPDCRGCRQDLLHWAQMLTEWLVVESQ